MSLPSTFAALTPERPSVMIKATFQAYSHQEDVELEMPANFWELPEIDQDELMDDEYDNWMDGGRRSWEQHTDAPEEPQAGAIVA